MNKKSLQEYARGFGWEGGASPQWLELARQIETIDPRLAKLIHARNEADEAISRYCRARMERNERKCG